MTFTLQLVDPSDDTTVLFDFHDPTGANNANGVRTNAALGGGALELQPADLETVDFRPTSMDGQRVVQARARTGNVGWSQRMRAASYDDLANAAGQLGMWLRAGGKALKWQPDGASDPRWLDLLPTSAPALFYGRAQDVGQAVGRFDTANGVPLRIPFSGFFRGALLNSETNILHNASLWRTSLVFANRPRYWAWDSTTGLSDESLAPLLEAYQFVMTGSTARNFEQTTDTGSVSEDDVLSLSFYARCAQGFSARLQLAGRFLDSSGTPLAAEEAGTLTAVAVADGWVRFELTMTAAPASTSKVKFTIRVQDSDSNPNTIQLKMAQCEKNAAPTKFVVGPEDMTNSPRALGPAPVVPIYVHGDAWAPVALTLRSFDSDAQVQEFLIGRRSDGTEVDVKRVVGYLNQGAAAMLSSSSLYNYTSSQTDADAANGNVAEVDYGSDPEPTVMQRRTRVGFYIDPDAMRGSWDVWLRCRATDTAKHEVQLRWAASFAGPVPNSNLSATLDARLAEDFPFVWVYLGTMAVPYDYPSLQGVALECWSRLVPDDDFEDGNLRLDFLSFVPIDDPEPSLTRVLAPPRSTEQWLGNQLSTPATDVTGDPTFVAADLGSGGDAIMNADLESVGTPPATGAEWQVGWQRITFRHTPRSGAEFEVNYRIVNITDDTTVSQLTGIALGTSGSQDVVMEFASEAGKLYQAQVWIDSRVKGQLRVRSITHETVPFLGQQDAIFTDPETGMVAKINSAGEFNSRLESRGAIPLWCPPGLSVIYVQAVDIPALSYAEGQSVLDRSWEATVEYAPRYNS